MQILSIYILINFYIYLYTHVAILQFPNSWHWRLVWPLLGYYINGIVWYVLFVWLLSFKMFFLGLFMLMYVLVVCSFFVVVNYSTVWVYPNLFIHALLSMAIWNVSCMKLLWICTFLYKSFCGYMQLFLLIIRLGVEFPSHR